MKKINKEHIIIWILTILPIIGIAAIYHRLPTSIPTNWGLDGTVLYSSKKTILMLAGLPLVMTLLFLFLPKIDPKKRNYDKFKNFYTAFIIVILLFLIGMLAITVIESFWPRTIQVGTVVTAAVGILFAFIGNMMPKIKTNFFMGIRTPWTLSDPEVWQKTHRLSGFLWFWGGIATFFLALFLGKSEKLLFIFFFLILAILTLIPTVMSYLWFRNKKNEN